MSRRGRQSPITHRKQRAVRPDPTKKGLDNYDIYIKEINSDSISRLTVHPETDSKPAWSPDGRHLAFCRKEVGGATVEIVVILAVGGEERLVTRTSHFTEAAFMVFDLSQLVAWTPDSQHLVVSQKNSDKDPAALVLFSLTTGEKLRLTQPPPGSRGDADPVFSPDSSKLAFVRSLNLEERDLYVMPVGPDWKPTGDPERLTEEKSVMSWPVWTGDGREIIFTSGWFSFPSLQKVAATPPAAKPIPFAVAGVPADSAAISPGSNRLAFSRAISDANLWRIEVDGSSRGVGAPRRLLMSTRQDAAPDYSPDGRRIVFESDRTGTHALWMSDADETNARLLFERADGGLSGSPRWSPDGERIVFDSYAEGQSDVFVINAAGADPFQLTTSPADDSVPNWSRDGRWVYFGSTRKGRMDIWKMSARGGEAVQVTRGGGNFAVLSPDGKTLYYVKELAAGSSLRRMPIEGGEETKVVDRVSTETSS